MYLQITTGSQFLLDLMPNFELLAQMIVLKIYLKQNGWYYCQ